MNRSYTLTIGTAAVWLAVLSLAISAQDKYTVKVPGGLAFSEFKGYEGWQAISISRNDKVMAVILGNPVMIDAYQAGIPANGKPVPDGARTTPSAGSRATRGQGQETTFLPSTESVESVSAVLLSSKTERQ